MPTILFIKQRIRRGPAIESSIEDSIEKAFSDIEGVRLEVYPLGENIRRAEDRLRGAPRDTLAKARLDQTERCIAHIRSHGFTDVFLLNGYLASFFNPNFFPALRASARRIAAWQLDDPYYVDMTLPFLPFIDAVFTVDSVTIPLYQRYEKVAEWLPLACDPSMQKTLPDLDEKYRTDVCFIGVPFKGSQRVKTIDGIADEIAGLRAAIIGATENDRWSTELRNFKKIAHQVMEKFISPEEAACYYNGAAINLNLHKDSYGHYWDRNAHRLIAQSPCERTFGIAACGGFQIIDATRPDLNRLFQVGEEIATFTDVSDLRSKLRYFLEHEQERNDMARGMQELVHAHHTYAQRARRIVEVAFS